MKECNVQADCMAVSNTKCNVSNFIQKHKMQTCVISASSLNCSAASQCDHKCLSNAKRPCDCTVLCLPPRSSLCSCAHSISDMTSFNCRDQGRDNVCPVLWNSKNARVNGGSNYDSFTRIPTRVYAAADRPASYGNQTISSTRPSYWIQISTVNVINIATHYQMFMTLTGELSNWQRLRRSAVYFYSKKTKKSLFEPPFLDLEVTYALHL